MTFVLRTNCLPMNRDTPAPKGKPRAFDPEAIVNSAQYERIFDDDQRDFLIKCMQPDPAKRATAEELL